LQEKLIYLTASVIASPKELDWRAIFDYGTTSQVLFVRFSGCMGEPI